MRKSHILLASILCLAPLAQAQKVTENAPDQITVSYMLPDIQLQGDGEYVLVELPDSYQSGTPGNPSLPVINSLLAVPFCDGIQVTVRNAQYDTLPLGKSDISPMQPARFKSDTSKHEFIVNKETYAEDKFYSMPLASVKTIGLARDMNYALLSFAPVSVNHASRQIVVCRSAEVVVSFLNADIVRTAEHYKRYHTPAFTLGPTLNTLAAAKAVSSHTPMRMVVLVPSSLQCDAVNQFADWKREQGLRVDVIPITATTAFTIGNMLKEMYDNATDADPAPTYVLIIGDHEQLPAHKSKVETSGGWWSFFDTSNDHITDLYYTTWTTGDNIPDCYVGRLSATNTATLTSIIDKTLYYEKYLFEDDSYLERAALVAGEDQGSSNDNAYRYGDPTMDYVAYYYVNSANGFNTVKYYKNNTSYYPTGVVVTGSSQIASTADSLKNYYNTGVGFINYSAHGDWDRWHKPEFTVTDANNMDNNDQPAFMIGNCCLTNKFEKGVCFGEALLRHGNRGGAVAYIGGTNSTLWTDDFTWSVGIRNNIRNTMQPEYRADAMGAYDHLFHTHGESIEKYAVTAAQYIMQGNMSVESSSSSDKLYYWEIYELLGDPSLMPWLGRADTLQATLTRGGLYSLNVHTVPGAYVALVQNDPLNVRAAIFTDSDGNARLFYPSDVSIPDCFVSITAQGYRPFKQQCDSSMVGIATAAVPEVMLSPNPASGHCVVSAEGLEHVSLMNTIGQTLRATCATDGQCILSLHGIPAGLYILRAETATGSSIKKLIVK